MMTEALVDSFLESLPASRERVLLLDYDGTIAPFTAHRDHAYPYPEARSLLAAIMNTCRTRIVMISGRPAREIPPLLGLEPHPEIWGTHGLECLYPDGRYEMAEVSRRALRVLAQARAGLEELGLMQVAEIKPGSISVHWRWLGSQREEEIRASARRIWLPLTFQADLQLTEFDGGLELRVERPNKGDVVRAIVAELEPDVPIAYLGDDITDEDAFRALQGRGLTVLVRSTERPSCAQAWIQPPGGLLDFLYGWMRACGGGR